MNIREKYEWSNLWWEDANDAALPRMLLMGDSITAGYRPCVNEHFVGRIAVDMLATSRAIDDPALVKEITYMLGEYDYQLIHFNNGLHGIDMDAPEYARAYERTVDLVSTLAPRARLALVTSTIISVVGEPLQTDGDKNPIVIDRNAIVAQIAAARALALDDLYTPSAMNPSWRLGDGYHYNDEGRRAQGDAVAAFISGLL